MKRQRGFTLFELTLVLVVLGVIIFVGINFTSQLGDNLRRQEMLLQESAWETVLDTVQKEHLNELAGANGVITSPTGVTLALTHAVVGVCGAANNVVAINALLRNFAGNDAEAQDLDMNPWSGQWCLRVGNPTDVTLSGLSVVVRPLAVLSGGRGGEVDTNTTVAIGFSCPNSTGDDSRHICSVGIAAAAAALETTQEKMEIIAAKLEAYSRAQAILTPQGGFVDYFLSTSVTTKIGSCSSLETNPAYDINTGGPFGSTANTSNSALGEEITDIIDDGTNFPDFEETLGITPADAIDGFGGIIHLDNSSCAARHPYHPDINNRTPPFSIRIVSALPGGGEVVRILFSDF